jgi:hypothetical protein
MARPSHPPRLDYSNYTWRRVQITRSSSSCSILHSPVICPDILLSTLFSNTLSLCTSFNIRDRLSHSCRTTGKIMVLYILIWPPGVSCA